MIKLSLLVCGLLTATSICAAESTQVNYYQDAHGNFIGYTPATYNQLENGYDSLARLFRDDWSGVFDYKGNLYQSDYPSTWVSIPTDKIYYKSTDCSGTGYFDITYEDIGSVEPFKTEVIKNNNNKYIKYKVQRTDTISPENVAPAVLSFSTIDTDGSLICEETPYAILKKEITKLEDKLENDNEGMLDEYIGELYLELYYNTSPTDVVNILDHGTDVTNAHSWMGFRDHDNGTVTGFVKGIDYDAGIEFVDVITQIPPTPPEELTYIRTSHDLNVRVQSKGSIGSVSVNKGSDIKLSQLFVEKISAGIFEVTIPESFLPKNKAVRHLQLQCSNNVGASSLIPNTSIGCYKMDNQNKIRVTTTRNEKYHSTDFSLNITY
ncbi:hypothetical protein CTM88_18210 [Photobacterium aquimaris]|uniref:Uncharacterized protein n=1 Tax=Photobacterium aquimaris TaxID=512643 RepID=A0A2T3IFR0_9GAMM|nr:hypothetical protein [Photobacterium aquimaris]OBU16171.1 hypothetical protein AYY20_19840 [Photobacterium aquimaris]PSU25144.1 hypothetical protein CTM88_18210 [Photobacterium aquimaris]